MLHKLLKMLEKLTAVPVTTAMEDAISGLADAKKQALTEDSMAEYSAAQVICHRAMAEFQKKRAARLAQFIKDEEHKPVPIISDVGSYRFHDSKDN